MRGSTSRFAGTQVGSRQRNWISLDLDLIPTELQVHSPLNRSVGTRTIAAHTLLPAAVADGGVITIKRIVGSVNFSRAVNFTVGDLENKVTGNDPPLLTACIYLAPIRSGLVDISVFLDAQGASDLDSQNFMWRRTFSPNDAKTGLVQTVVTATGTFLYTAVGNNVLDVKSQRRYDRSQFALMFGYSLATAEYENDSWVVTSDMRALVMQQGSL